MKYMARQGPGDFTVVLISDFLQLERLVTEYAGAHGVDPLRVRRLFERIPQESPGGISAPSAGRLFASAFAYLLPEEALSFIEEADDLPKLVERVNLTSYLDDVFTPFYSLGELTDLTGQFIAHLRANRESIIQTGLPKSHFMCSFWLDRKLGESYCTRQYQESYKWHGFGECESILATGSSFLPDAWGSHYVGLAEIGMHFALEYFAANRQRKNLGVLPFPYRPEWRCQGSDGAVPYEDADYIDGLMTDDARRLDSSRGKLFDLKIAILGLSLHAILKNDANSLWTNCLEVLSNSLDADEVEFLLRMDSFYRGYRQGLPWFEPRTATIAVDKRGLATGGLTELLEFIGHVEQELRIGTYTRVRKALEPDLEPSSRDRPQFFPDSVYPPYFEFAAYDRLPSLDDALGVFQKLEADASAFWQSYQCRVNDAIENEFYENIEIRKRVKRRSVRKFVPVVDSYATWVNAQLETGAPMLGLTLSSPTQDTLSDQNIFRRDGGDWTVRYKGGRLMAFTSSVGMFYIGYLVNHPAKMFTVSALKTVHQQLQSGPSDAIYGKMANEDLEREGMSTQGAGSAGPILDKHGLQKVRERLKGLGQELEDAEADHDHAAQERLEDEKIELIKEIQRAVGPSPKGGLGTHKKLHQIAAGSKKDQDSVRNAINRDLERIERKDLSLGQHLRNSLKLQDLFVYQPEPPVAWNS
jgi:hypothetical protein